MKMVEVLSSVVEFNTGRLDCCLSLGEVKGIEPLLAKFLPGAEVGFDDDTFYSQKEVLRAGAELLTSERWNNVLNGREVEVPIVALHQCAT